TRVDRNAMRWWSRTGSSPRISSRTRERKITPLLRLGEPKGCAELGHGPRRQRERAGGRELDEDGPFRGAAVDVDRQCHRRLGPAVDDARLGPRRAAAVEDLLPLHARAVRIAR